MITGKSHVNCTQKNVIKKLDIDNITLDIKDHYHEYHTHDGTRNWWCNGVLNHCCVSNLYSRLYTCRPGRDQTQINKDNTVNKVNLNFSC